MRPLSARELLQIREWGERRHPVDRALVILSRGFPEKSWEELTKLDIDHRNRMLLQLREGTLGTQLDSIAVCPHCGERLEFSLDTRELQSSPAPSLQPAYTAVHDDLVIEYTPPNSLDLAAAAAATNENAARTTLLHRSIRRVSRDTQEISIDTLPQDAAESLANEIQRLWPLAEIRLSLHCPNCEHEWEPLFDIPTFFWSEIESRSRRVVEDVHTLAKEYGWSEDEILSMSSTRRKFYLERVG